MSAITDDDETRYAIIASEARVMAAITAIHELVDGTLDAPYIDALKKIEL